MQGKYIVSTRYHAEWHSVQGQTLKGTVLSSGVLWHGGNCDIQFGTVEWCSVQGIDIKMQGTVEWCPVQGIYIKVQGTVEWCSVQGKDIKEQGTVEWCSVQGKAIKYKVLLSGVQCRENTLNTRYS